jgi:hypothetical protein
MRRRARGDQLDNIFVRKFVPGKEGEPYLEYGEAGGSPANRRIAA